MGYEVLTHEKPLELRYDRNFNNPKVFIKSDEYYRMYYPFEIKIGKLSYVLLKYSLDFEFLMNEEVAWFLYDKDEIMFFEILRYVRPGFDFELDNSNEIFDYFKLKLNDNKNHVFFDIFTSFKNKDDAIKYKLKS